MGKKPASQNETGIGLAAMDLELDVPGAEGLLLPFNNRNHRRLLLAFEAIDSCPADWAQQDRHLAVPFGGGQLLPAMATIHTSGP
jgi:hypothetical protein